ncbi:uncharacterized protein LOC132636273 [Lycium barbarum]|uniref:uncharacterized protein LOC132636273 n=1 Tax=Lycium barbarum TaxID=112863 RepID=UPI00293E97C3|nr:uncharacterized protein LOC132636273 [Lycium barbarum]
MKLPCFNGNDCPDAYFDWVQVLEETFHIFKVSNLQRVIYATDMFINHAYRWWNEVMRKRYRDNPSTDTKWKEFKRPMEEKLAPTYFREKYCEEYNRGSTRSRKEEYDGSLKKYETRNNAKKEDLRNNQDVNPLSYIHSKGRSRDSSYGVNHRHDVKSPFYKSNEVLGAYLMSKEEKSFATYNNEHSSGMQGNLATLNYTSRASSDKSVSCNKSLGARNCLKNVNENHVGSSSPSLKELTPTCTCAIVSPLEKNIELSTCDKNDTSCVENVVGSKNCAFGEVVESSTSLLKNTNDEVVLGNEDLLVRRSLSTCLNEEEESTQRHNIFYTRCLILGWMYTLVVNGASCDNLVSATLVKELKLKTFNHPRPCRLQWLNECGELKVSRMVKIPFMIEDYKDEVTCGVVQIYACHIILGGPWMYDRDVMHSGRKNHYTLEMEEKVIKLEPLEPNEVLKEQVNLRVSLKNTTRKSEDERER